jgi:hypothetical protein
VTLYYVESSNYQQKLLPVQYFKCENLQKVANVLTLMKVSVKNSQEIYVKHSIGLVNLRLHCRLAIKTRSVLYR